METAHGGQAPWRGTGGPLHITRGPRDNPLHEAFVTAATQAGYAATSDYNGHRQEGFGPADMTVWKGRRWSAANAYLKPALRTGRVKLFTRTLADRILFDGPKAIGVRTTRKSKQMDILATKAVILPAGAIASPAILQDPYRRCRAASKAGIEVIADRKGVGANLQDHLEVYFRYLQPACPLSALKSVSKP